MAQDLEQVESVDSIAAHFQSAPGTEFLYDAGNQHGSIARKMRGLQHVKQGDSHILLVPQPSITDPNDPLLWSPIKKWSTFLNGLGYAFLGGVTGPIMAAWMVEGSKHFGITMQRMSNANGATLVCQGVATTIWMPFAVKYGRRPVYLFSTFLMAIACIWLGIASQKNFAPFFAGRVFLGVFEAPIESIVPSTITDIFFLHDRGQKVSFYGLSVLGGNELGPMLSAFIIQHLGMNWGYYITAMFIGLNFVLMIFFMPETLYLGKRPSIIAALTTDETDEKLNVAHVEVSSAYQSQPKTYLQSLKFWGLNDPRINLLHAFLRPFVLLSYPTVLWACFIYGMSLSWNVILGILLAQLFAPPPYLFDSQAQGLIFLSPLIGSLVGTYLCGPLADQIATFFTKRNYGIREPEMRLPTCIIAAFLTFSGALVAGLCLHNLTHWIGPVMGFGILSAGAQMGATLAMSYALDCHRELSVELMVTVSSIKSLTAWIWTWVSNDWLTSAGPLVVFCTVGAVNVGVYLSTVLIYWKGKSIRLWLHERDLLTRLGLGSSLSREFD